MGMAWVRATGRVRVGVRWVPRAARLRRSRADAATLTARRNRRHPPRRQRVDARCAAAASDGRVRACAFGARARDPCTTAGAREGVAIFSFLSESAGSLALDDTGGSAVGAPVAPRHDRRRATARTRRRRRHEQEASMRRTRGILLTALCGMLLWLPPAFGAELSVSASSVSVSVGASASVKVSGASGTVRVASSASSIATASYASPTITITGVTPGPTKVKVSDRRSSGLGRRQRERRRRPHRRRRRHRARCRGACSRPTISACTAPTSTTRSSASCRRSTSCMRRSSRPAPRPRSRGSCRTSTPTCTTARRRVRSIRPGAGSINTTSNLAPSGDQEQLLGAGAAACGKAGTLGGFGVPVALSRRGARPVRADSRPRPVFRSRSGRRCPSLAPAQQQMPSPSNVPQKFARYDAELPFFASFPFGDDRRSPPTGSPPTASRSCRSTTPGRTNPYPLMRVQAVAKGAERDGGRPTSRRASTSCCRSRRKPTAGTATTASMASPSVFASVTKYANGAPWVVATEAAAPGPDKVNNAAKINILRLHDAKWGAKYTSSANGAATPCNGGTESSCLDQRRAIQCSQCHYSPALDLAQVGPIDEPAIGVERPPADAAHLDVARDALQPRPVRHACSPRCRCRRAPAARWPCRPRSSTRRATSAIRASRRSACAARWARAASPARTATAT